MLIYLFPSIISYTTTLIFVTQFTWTDFNIISDIWLSRNKIQSNAKWQFPNNFFEYRRTIFIISCRSEPAQKRKNRLRFLCISEETNNRYWKKVISEIQFHHDSHLFFRLMLWWAFLVDELMSSRQQGCSRDIFQTGMSRSNMCLHCSWWKAIFS